MLIVHHFGLHTTEGGLPLLVQDDGVQHVLNIPIDVEVKVKKLRRNFHCPHNIDLSAGIPPALSPDPLIDIFMPVPKQTGAEPVFLLDNDANREVVKQLMRLSSSTGSSGLVPMWMLKPEILVDSMHLTNLQPLVLFGYHHYHHARLQRLCAAAQFAPRRLVVLIPELQWSVQPNRMEIALSAKDLAPLDLERMGAGRLRQLMLKQGD